MLNPWFFGLEAVQLGWRAQTELALKLMQTFAGDAPAQTSPNDPLAAEFKPREDIKTQGKVSPAEALAAIKMGQTSLETANPRRRKASKLLPVVKKKSHVKGSKRTAAASHKSATKIRRPARKKR
jgi:hypothetical protein